MPDERYGEMDEERILRRELRKWELRFHGQIPNQKKLIRLKFSFALKHGFDVLLKVVSEVVMACFEERRNRADWEPKPESQLTVKNRKHPHRRKDRCHHKDYRHSNHH